MSIAIPQPRFEVKTLVRDDELWVREMSGSDAGLVLVFTGVKHGTGGVPLDEFIGTASNGGENHVLFISDMQRSWYSRPGLVARIVAIVQRYCAAHGIDKLWSIGNSMGGYGAILFCDRLPIRAACAFSPQVSMHAAMITERRWKIYRPAFGDQLARSVVASIRASPTQVFVFFGRDDAGDMAQARLLPDLPNLHLRKLRGGGHDVAAKMKTAGLFADFVAAAFAADPGRVDTACTLFETRNMTKLRLAFDRLFGKPGAIAVKP